MKIKIIYIASPSYSGSTLLSRLLNAHSQLVSVGEHQVLGNKKSRKLILLERQCTCGVNPLIDCPFWRAVEQELVEVYQLSLEVLALDAEDDLIFKKHNNVFFKAIQKVSKKNIIIDSSKNWLRLSRLKKAGFDVTPIQLKRNIYGVVNSGIKYDNNWLKQSFNYWYYYQKLHEVIGFKSIQIQYETLVQNPEEQLTLLMNQLSLSFEESQLDWAPIISHYIGGNPMRYQKKSTLEVDQSWKGELTWFKKVAIGGFAVLCSLPAKMQFFIYRSLSKLKN